MVPCCHLLHLFLFCWWPFNGFPEFFRSLSISFHWHIPKAFHVSRKDPCDQRCRKVNRQARGSSLGAHLLYYDMVTINVVWVKGSTLVVNLWWWLWVHMLSCFFFRRGTVQRYPGHGYQKKTTLVKENWTTSVVLVAPKPQRKDPPSDLSPNRDPHLQKLLNILRGENGGFGSGTSQKTAKPHKGWRL